MGKHSPRIQTIIVEKNTARPPGLSGKRNESSIVQPRVYSAVIIRDIQYNVVSHKSGSRVPGSPASRYFSGYKLVLEIKMAFSTPRGSLSTNFHTDKDEDVQSFALNAAHTGVGGAD